MKLLGEWVMSNLVLIHLEMVLVSVQDRCMVWAKHTMAQKLFLTHPMVLLHDEAQVDACFLLFGDSAKLDANRCTVCGERTIGS